MNKIGISFDEIQNLPVRQNVTGFAGVTISTGKITSLKRRNLNTFKTVDYLSLADSLCSVLFLHHLQYLTNLSLSGVLVLFFSVK